jgi:putative MFS transporter
VRMAARGAGLGQAAGGVGKILGPLVLAMVAGTNNFITPQATADAVLPGFLFLAVSALVAGLAFTFMGVETHGKVLSLNDVAESKAPG